MPILIFRSCCCCDLRTGVILIALFSVGISALNIYTGSTTVRELKRLQPKFEKLDERDKLPIPWKYYDDTINLGWSNIAFFVSDLIISFVLLIGGLQRNKSILTAWMSWTVVCALYHFSVAIFFLSIWKGVPTFGYTMIVDLLIMVYFLLVVYSFKQEIIYNENHAALPVVTVAGQSAPGGCYQQSVAVPPYPQQQTPAFPQAAPPPYMYVANQPPPPYSQQMPETNEQKVPLT